MKLLAPIAALVLTLPLQAQNVWTVAQTGGADFFDPQSAVDAASDGDLIYVTGGAYAALSIDGKSVTLQATGIATIASLGFFNPEEPAVSVSNLSADQTVYLRGFQIEQLGYYAGYSVLLSNNEGAIVLEDCQVAGAGRPLEARNCQSLTLANCQVDAPRSWVEIVSGIFLGSLFYNGIGALNSNLFFYDCTIHGGDGLAAGEQFLGPEFASVNSGNGVSLSGSVLFANGCTFVGGTGPDSFKPFCSNGSSGGAGVLIDSASHADLLDCVTVGGTGGAGACDGPPGSDGSGVQALLGGSFSELAGTARRGSLAVSANSGGPFQVELQGAPGDLVFAAISSGFKAPVGLPGGTNFVHVEAPFELLPLGVLLSSGEQTLDLFAPELSVGTSAQAFATQFVFLDEAGFHEGGPTQLVVLSGGL